MNKIHQTKDQARLKESINMNQAYRYLSAIIVFLMLSVPAMGQNLPDPPPNWHGMLVLGKKGKVYLLHLAMRNNASHMFQLIMEVELDHNIRTRVGDRTFIGEAVDFDTATPEQIYFLDRNDKKNETSVYTFEPNEPFVLTEIPQGQRLTFRGNIVRGHFERDASPPRILKDVIVKVSRILYFQDLRVFDPNSTHPLEEGKLQFLLFGANGQYFITHKITLHGEKEKSNDNGFHQVFPVGSVSAQHLNFDLIRQTALVEIDASKATSQGRLPKFGGNFASVIKNLIKDTDTPFSMEIGPEHYLEELM
jgi:hypothetical protein